MVCALGAQVVTQRASVLAHTTLDHNNLENKGRFRCQGNIVKVNPISEIAFIAHAFPKINRFRVQSQ